jgi:S1-C subfamily serine protease
MQRRLFLAFSLVLALAAAKARAAEPTPAAPDFQAPTEPGAPAGRVGSRTAPLAGAQSLNAAIVNALDRLGYPAGPPRDNHDRQLRDAIKSFQHDQGLPESGKVSKRLVAALAAELNRRHIALGGGGNAAPPNGAMRRLKSGTGIVVSAAGYVLTNHHVIRDCKEMRVGEAEKIDMVAVDNGADLALLKLRKPRANVARFRDGNNARPGEDVVVLGYPLYGLLGTDAIVTTGSISALAGIHNDRSLIQISAPVQPGNSGGPVLDASGHVVGVVVSVLDAVKIASIIGAVPENVNFAINEATARRFLDTQHVPYRVEPSSEKLSAPDIAETGAGFTLLLECWGTHPLPKE